MNVHRDDAVGQQQVNQDRIFQAHRDRFAAAAARAQAEPERPSLLEALLGLAGRGGAA